MKGNKYTNDDNVKKEWIDKLLNNEEIKAIGVIYFDSKNWYIFELILRKTYIMVYFGNNKPSIDSIYARDYIKKIEFNSLSYLPSTMIPIDEAITVIHDATISTNYTDMNKNQNKIVGDATRVELLCIYQFTKSNKSYNTRAKIDNANLGNNVYSALIDYNNLSYIYKNSFIKEHSYRNLTDYNNYGSITAIQAFKANSPYTLSCNINQICDLNENNIDKKLLVICHGVYIGHIYDIVFMHRYKNKFLIKNSNNEKYNMVNLMRNSFELDAHWNYSNAANINNINDNNGIKLASLSNTDLYDVSIDIQKNNICNIKCCTQKNKFIETEYEHKTKSVDTIMYDHVNDIYDEIYDEDFTVEKLIEQTEEEKNGE